jgi:transposase
MFISSDNNLTDWAKLFIQPSNSTHRQYEALRAHFVENIPTKEIAKRFGYTEGSVRVLIHHFKQNPQRSFFIPPAKGPHKEKEPKQDPMRQSVIRLRKQNLSIYDISRVLDSEGKKISPVAVSIILKEEGFARLPRRKDEQRLPVPGTGPTVAAVADVRQLQLGTRRLRTKFGGIFLFIPYLASIPLDEILAKAGFPGSKMIPASCAIRSLLALKLFGSARHSHVMSYVLDEGLALFAGLNVIPKRSFLTEYSCRINAESYRLLMRMWFDAMRGLGLDVYESFDLDFHTIPFHGEDALVQKHYVTKRSRRQKGILAFLAQDAQTRVFCYVNGDIRKETQNDEILQFVQFWKDRTQRLPQELIFDSKLTTYKNLDKLNKSGIHFITLRRRSKNMVEDIRNEPLSAWRRITLDGVSRMYRTPRILDQRISLTDYQGPIRQLVVIDLGHEEPTFLLTNQLTRSAPKLIKRYAQRMIIENTIQDGIDFFHMDALSSAVAMKVNLDLQLTIMASSLYRIFSSKIGNGYQNAKSRHIFRDFIDATAQITINRNEIIVRFQKRSHNPLLIAAGFEKINTPVAWLGGKKIRFVFG